MGIAFCVGYCQIDRKMIFMGRVADYLIESGVCSDECLAKLEAAEQKMRPTLGESAASGSESKAAPKRII